MHFPFCIDACGGDEEVSQQSFMRILYILPFVPWHVRVRSNNLIPRLARRHQIHLLCLSGSAEEDARAWPLRGLCQEVRCIRHRKSRAFLQCAVALATRVPLRMAYFASPGMRAAVRQAIAEFSPDVIYVERWRALQYVPADVQVPVLCDPTDSMLLYNQRLLRTGSWWERVVGFEEYLKFLRHEAKLAGRAGVVVFCSRVDLECVQKNAPAARYALVPNGVDCEAFFPKQPQEEEPDTIVFTGNFGYRPNRHAAWFFLEKSFPLIRQEIPHVRFIAVGSGAAQYLGKDSRSTPGLKVVDFVPELRPYIAKAAVAVAPITVGAGVSNKLGEAFATGTPVVATRLACGDLPVRDGVHLLLADDPKAFAEKVVRLLREPELRRHLALNAQRLVEEAYDWEIVAGRMEQLMRQVVYSSVRVGEPIAVIA
jgi:glycosyltransferase involved in cell wall biosynthesis